MESLTQRVRPTRTPYPSDVSDEEWAFVAPYLTLMTEDAPQRAHALREVFNGLRWLVRTPANEPERAQVSKLAAAVQEVTGDTVELAYVDQGYTGDQPAQDAAAHGIRLEVVKLPQAKRGFVLLPRRWVVERSNAWAARFRRLARDYERLSETLAGLHFLVFACLMLVKIGRASCRERVEMVGVGVV